MRLLLLLAATVVAACAVREPLLLPDPLPAILLLGEQHDAPGHPARQQAWVRALAERGQLAGLALEMAEQGMSTAGLPPDASEAQVRSALRWNEEAWPWARYGPAVMLAVRTGAPVLGANLPRAAMRAAMQEAALDQALGEPRLDAQRRAIRDGHCGLLPEAQVAPMTRVQIARDRAMAQTLAGAARVGGTVVLIAGGGHVDPEVGVPRHLPAGLSAQPVALPPEASGKDHCAELRRRWGDGKTP